MDTFHRQINTPPGAFDQLQCFGWVFATAAGDQPTYDDAGAPLETQRAADEDRSLVPRSLDDISRGSRLELVEVSEIKSGKAAPFVRASRLGAEIHR